MAEALIFPRFLHEKGAAAVLDAIEREDDDFFIPVWMTAGFRFSPVLIHLDRGDLRIGVITMPMPREMTEAWLGAVVGKRSDPTYLRYFLLEMSIHVLDQTPATVIGEWAGSTHRNHGGGPLTTSDLVADCAAFVARVEQIVSAAPR